MKSTSSVNLLLCMNTLETVTFDWLIIYLIFQWNTTRYGVLIPLLVSMPYYIIKWLDLRNSILIVSFGGSLALQAFRCSTAIHGTTRPLAVEKKRFNYCIYFCSIVDLTFDDETGDFVYVQHPLREAMIRLKKLLTGVFLLVCMYSIMISVEYELFEDNLDSYVSYFHWKHLLNNLSFACKFFFFYSAVLKPQSWILFVYSQTCLSFCNWRGCRYMASMSFDRIFSFSIYYCTHDWDKNKEHNQ